MPSTRIPQGSTSGQQTKNKLPLVLLVITIIAILASAAHGQTFTVLHSFAGAPDGAGPVGGLVLDTTGNLYGTTSSGGAYNAGTAFRLTPNGAISQYSFTGGMDGGNPAAGLVRYGNFAYGTTTVGGTYNQGTVFKLDSKGNETVLYNFTGGADGSWPAAALIQDTSGNLCGTAMSGGYACYCPYGSCSGCGTVFKLDTTGNLTVLYTFVGGSDGMNPNSALLLDAAGDLYGTTVNGGGACNAGFGGPAACGTVFQLDPSGKETVLHRFAAGKDGAYPNGLIRDAARNLYGSTDEGGRYNYGNVFELIPGHGLVTLYSFTGGWDGEYPAGNLAAGKNSAYGTATSGPGDWGCGTVFQLDAVGLTVLHTFVKTDGCLPSGPLILDTAGNIYGTTGGGGIVNGACEYGCGVVFKITPQ